MIIKQTSLLNAYGQERVDSPKRDRELDATKRSDKIALALSKPTIDAVPDVRMNRIEAVRARIESGFYDLPQMREGIAEAFMKAQVL